jgi:tetratricopeptide (TPR) repeat protein
MRQRKDKPFYTPLLAALLVLVSLPCQAVNDPLFEQARHLESTGDFKKAIELYEQLLKSHPNDENIKEALIWSWRQWNQKNPSDGDIVIGWGQELQRMREFDPALHEYFWAKYMMPQSAARADQLIASCYQALADDQPKVLQAVPDLGPWLATVKSQLESNWKPTHPSGQFRIKVEFGPSGKVRMNEGRSDTGDPSDYNLPGLLNQVDMHSLPNGVRSLDVECVFNFQTMKVDLLVSGLGTDIETIVVEPIDSATLKKLLEEKGLSAK